MDENGCVEDILMATLEKSPKDNNDDKGFHGPIVYQVPPLLLSGLSRVPTVTKQPDNSFNPMK